MFVSDPSCTLPSIPLLPPAVASLGLVADVGRLSLPLGKRKKELVTSTQIMASVALKTVIAIFHGSVALVLGCVRPVLSTAVYNGGKG